MLNDLMSHLSAKKPSEDTLRSMLEKGWPGLRPERRPSSRPHKVCMGTLLKRRRDLFLRFVPDIPETGILSLPNDIPESLVRRLVDVHDGAPYEADDPVQLQPELDLDQAETRHRLLYALEASGELQRQMLERLGVLEYVTQHRHEFEPYDSQAITPRPTRAFYVPPFRASDVDTAHHQQPDDKPPKRRMPSCTKNSPPPADLDLDLESHSDGRAIMSPPRAYSLISCNSCSSL
ncbi:unnamed protein product [Vitrella brassicaformis CCMP3155]|uniref:Uncharacterized protein n=1 Tax=Vitrella brassicaformis (strain CCMP3155) TaxID=1169540 RepID=A0A0G4GAI0_VITBC|nr:unnamed protein product [Vitrella brassicaformis CCMP3155]|eukprot:CEM25979.1 unnamed protein product [Vitrella brassicaformis CCMP3155]